MNVYKNSKYAACINSIHIVALKASLNTNSLKIRQTTYSKYLKYIENQT